MYSFFFSQISSYLSNIKTIKMDVLPVIILVFLLSASILSQIIIYYRYFWPGFNTNFANTKYERLKESLSLVQRELSKASKNKILYNSIDYLTILTIVCMIILLYMNSGLEFKFIFDVMSIFIQ